MKDYLTIFAVLILAMAASYFAGKSHQRQRDLEIVQQVFNANEPGLSGMTLNIGGRQDRPTTFVDKGDRQLLVIVVNPYYEAISRKGIW